MSTETLWAIHIPGPDDYHAAPSKDAAQHMADKHNASVADFLESHTLPSGWIMATAKPWTGSAADHAEEMAVFDYAAWGLGTEAA